MIDLATKGSAFVQAAVHSLEAGDWSLTGEDDDEKLQLWHRQDLSNGTVGLVEDAYKMEAFVEDAIEEGIPPAGFDCPAETPSRDSDDSPGTRDDSAERSPVARRRRMQVVYT